MSEIDQDKIQEIKEMAAEAQESSAQFMEPGQKIKSSKRGRPAGSKTKSAKKDASENPKKSEKTEKSENTPKTSEILKLPLNMISQAAVKYVDHPAAAMQPNELEMIAECLGQLLDKYMPQAFDQYGLEITTAVVVGQYGLRIVALKKAVEAQRAEQMKNAGPKTSDVRIPEVMPIKGEEWPPREMGATDGH